MSPDNVVRRLYAAYNEHDVQAVGHLYHVDGVHCDVANGQRKDGRTAIMAGLNKFFVWFPDVHWAVELVSGENNGVIAATYRMAATLQSSMGPVQPRGQSIVLRGAHVLHVRDGLISSSEDYWDAMTFQKQLNTPNGGK
jgi:steroid delta-isomerase-like uncharacterized protein